MAGFPYVMKVRHFFLFSEDIDFFQMSLFIRTRCNICTLGGYFASIQEKGMFSPDGSINRANAFF